MKYDLIVRDGIFVHIVDIRLNEEMKNEQFQEIIETLWRYETPMTDIELHIWETKQVGNDEVGYSEEFTYDKTHRWDIKEPTDLTNLVEKIRTTVHFIDKL